MPYIEEKQDSRTVNWNAKSATTSRTYHMFDYTDSQDAILALGAYVPTDVQVATYLCTQPEYEVTPVFSDPERTLYEGKVIWKTPDVSAGGGGGSTNTAKDPQEPEDHTSLTVSFTTMTDVAQQGINANYNFLLDDTWITVPLSSPQGINRQNDMLPPEGIEINKPIVLITAKTVIASTKCTPAWQEDKFNRLWTTNDGEWNGLRANHVMFTGMELSQRSDDHWDVTYSLEYRPPNDYTDPGTGITLANHVAFSFYNDSTETADVVLIKVDNPWMVIDARYNEIKQTIDDGSGYEKTVRSVNAIYVHTVYGESDFSELDMVGIPISN
jgi:hypothetical protein